MIKLAVAGHNTEKCFEVKVYGTDNGTRAIELVKLSVGDFLVFYKAKEGFSGIWEVTKPYYYDESPIWEDGTYPNRVGIKPIVELKPEQYVSAKGMVDDLKMVTHPLYYGLAFRRNLADICEEDFNLIKSKLEESKNK